MSSLDSAFQRLRDTRALLLRLHKALLDSERIVYEQFHGRIPSSGEFFRLVIEHEWFSWLRPMSQLIVQIDDVLSPKEPMTLGQAEELLEKPALYCNPRQKAAVQKSATTELFNAILKSRFSTLKPCSFSILNLEI